MGKVVPSSIQSDIYGKLTFSQDPVSSASPRLAIVMDKGCGYVSRGKT